MAGSYNHCVEKPSGKLLRNEDLVRMLENGGDVYEAVEEMYGMIWALAERVQGEIRSRAGHVLQQSPEALRAEIVEDARQAYQQGLRLSPGTDGSLPDGDD